MQNFGIANADIEYVKAQEPVRNQKQQHCG